ncbi:MAG: hypothetical protein HKO56_00805 [Bacteroidia bacterium]|nr:hypothetical protein [Bacteroidia bacterium]NNC85213.1 hypothetical protein [Bacteroidia bacterium]NNM15165.1 hypothetical protein [Bacteroidia bacterium]
MIAEISFKNKKIKEQIDELVGKPYSFIDRIKKGGIGSTRMIIEECSIDFHPYLTDTNKLKFASIEIRPKGILVHLNKNYSHFAWVIPYYKLTIYKSKHISIHADGSFLKCSNKSINTNNDKFLSKLMEYKNENLSGLNLGI